MRIILITGLVSVAAFSRAQQTDCIRQECSSAINYPVDLTGKPDSRATTWGLADAVVVPNKFIVPSGYRVRILRFEGNFIAWPHGVYAPGNHVGVSWGFKNTAPDNSVHIAAVTDQSAGGADNCFAYFQYAIGGDREVNQEIHIDTHVGGLLGPDHLMNGVLAIFLSEIEPGKPPIAVHMELTGVMTYRFEPAK
jgi:hypothetical protein